MLAETLLTFGMYEGCQLQPDKFLACITMHLVCRGIRLQHKTRFQIGDDQPVAGRIKNALILRFFFFRWSLVRVFAHNLDLLLSSIVCRRWISANTSSGFHFKVCQFTVLMIYI